MPDDFVQGICARPVERVAGVARAGNVRRARPLFRRKLLGILDEGQLFFKTDATSAADYTAHGMGPFTYESRGKLMTMAYHEVPPDVLENAPELTSWARRAIGIAANSKKPPKKTLQNG
jgi:TfoX/Sxy family transcriptional regulator of competence genes